MDSSTASPPDLSRMSIARDDMTAGAPSSVLASPSITLDDIATQIPSLVISSPLRPSHSLRSPALPMRSLFGPTYDALNSSMHSGIPIATQKESEDISETPESTSPRQGTGPALSRMLASNLTHTPADSRSTSYNHGNSNLKTLSTHSGTSSIALHLYHRGLLEGKHSDIAVLAFGHRYLLHRLVLVRAPFFDTALSGPWRESFAQEVSLSPDETDRNITRAAFELALKHLYGCDITDEVDAEAIGLFATGCWLEMPELIETAITSMLKQMTTNMLSPIFEILNEQYYGHYAERILGSAKAILCRDGWEMPLKHWDSVPGDVVAEVVGGDGFFVHGEWERWVLAKRLLDRRLKQLAMELGVLNIKASTKVQAPDYLAHRFDLLSRQSTVRGKGIALSEEDEGWNELYSHPDVTPLFQLLQTGVHYMHLDFEQLQYIRGARDIFDLPMMPDTVIASALWMQMELRQKVVNARETDLELGLSHSAPLLAAFEVDRSDHDRSKGKDTSTRSGSGEGHVRPSYTFLNVTPDRRFTIPMSDCTVVMGDSDASIPTPPSRYRHTRTSTLPTNPPPTETTNTTMSSPDPRRFFAYPSEVNNSSWQTPAELRTAPTSPTSAAAAALYTSFPPFRFAVEFPNPRFIREKRRVYSRTIFYAGSHWNVYVQKVKCQKSPQLGVYLHRAREESPHDRDPAAATTSMHPASVDERIGQLEREMILRSGERRTGHGATSSVRSNNGRDTLTRQRQLMMRYGGLEHTEASVGGASLNNDNDASSMHSGRTRRTMGRPVPSRQHHHPDGAFESYISLESDSDDEDYLFNRDDPPHWSTSAGLISLPRFASPRSVLPTSSSSTSTTAPPAATSRNNDPNLATGNVTAPPHPSTSSRPNPIPAVSSSSSRTTTPHTSSNLHHHHQEPFPSEPPCTSHSCVPPPRSRSTPTLPPYSDPRPTIKTYFKIFSPSKRGRLLSVYESAPDKFDISQSWGWRSPGLMMEEGISGAGGGGGNHNNNNDEETPELEDSVGTRREDNIYGLEEDQRVLERRRGNDDESLDDRHRRLLTARTREEEVAKVSRMSSFSGGGPQQDRDERWRRRSAGNLRFMIVIGNL